MGLPLHGSVLGYQDIVARGRGRRNHSQRGTTRRTRLCTLARCTCPLAQWTPVTRVLCCTAAVRHDDAVGARPVVRSTSGSPAKEVIGDRLLGGAPIARLLRRALCDQCGHVNLKPIRYLRNGFAERNYVGSFRRTCSDHAQFGRHISHSRSHRDGVRQFGTVVVRHVKVTEYRGPIVTNKNVRRLHVCVDNPDSVAEGQPKHRIAKNRPDLVAVTRGVQQWQANAACRRGHTPLQHL
mmetsp:Transcript_10989/g.34879  ORF Transcript_10989/g.34879 Transcript_10989/m.34879 type:complete len:238 (+) Transcript_10989:1321-2034(+)